MGKTLLSTIFIMKKGSGTNRRIFIRLLFGEVNIDRNKKENKKNI